MKMRSISRFFMGMLAVCTIAACSDDLGNGSNVNPDTSKDAVYMNVTVQLPVAGGGARSQTDAPDDNYGTSTDGTEVGKDRENAVTSVLLVLAENGGANDNRIIASGVSSGPNLSVTNGVVTSTHKISKTSLANYYGTNGTLADGKEKIKVYVFCNPTSALLAKFSSTATTADTEKSWVDETAELVEDPSSTIGVTTGADIWGGKNHDKGFLMSTARKKDIEKTIPKALTYWDDCTEPNKAFDLSGSNSGDINNSANGPIQVERSVARFDFKDGSPTGTGDNTYTDVVKDKDGNGLVNIQLTKMALVNMSKHFYYLRRVSNDGLDKADNNGFELCGTETTTNYVVDTDAEAKHAQYLTSFPYSSNFNFCLGTGTGTLTDGNWTIDENTRRQWYTTDISAVTSEDNEEDNDNTWNSDTKHETTKDGYRIWRYVTENTIPRPSDGNIGQRNGISTGIVFKGKMIAKNKSATDAVTQAIEGATGESDTDPILYAYGDNLFVRWTEVRDYAIDNKENKPAFYDLVFGVPENSGTAATPKKGEGEKYENATYSDVESSPDFLWNHWYNTKSHNDAEALKAFKEAATGAKFTLYQSSKDGSEKGYYCYYYYWNRHNDNGNPGVMGPMEFAVVRNNVYKLAVTEISKLGHPRISENDPDPVDPEDPDESGDVYIKLSVKVLPWVVRINNIKF